MEKKAEIRESLFMASNSLARNGEGDASRDQKSPSTGSLTLVLSLVQKEGKDSQGKKAMGGKARRDIP